MSYWIVKCARCLIEMVRDEIGEKQIWRCPKCGYTIDRRELKKENKNEKQ